MKILKIIWKVVSMVRVVGDFLDYLRTRKKQKGGEDGGL